MKQILSVMLIISFVFGVALAPRRAHAVAGAMTAPVGVGVALGLLGVGIGAGGVYMIYQGNNLMKGGFIEGFFGFWAIVFGVMVTGGGIVLLDGEHSSVVGFGPVSHDAAMKLGLTEEEFTAYNGELEELNAIRETVVGELNARGAHGEKPTLEMSNKEWARYQEAVSPEALSAAKKIVRQLLVPQPKLKPRTGPYNLQAQLK